MLYTLSYWNRGGELILLVLLLHRNVVSAEYSVIKSNADRTVSACPDVFYYTPILVFVSTEFHISILLR
jgi:hypothetical protein